MQRRGLSDWQFVVLVIAGIIVLGAGMAFLF